MKRYPSWCGSRSAVAPEPAVTQAALARADQMAMVFVRAMREAGVDIAILFAQTLGEIDLDSRQELYWAGRATLVHRPEDLGLYDSVFRAFWIGGAPAEIRGPGEVEHITLAVDDPDGLPPGELDELDQETGPVLAVRYSAQEVLRHKDFALCSSEELNECYSLMSKLRLSGAQRESRRSVRSKRRRGRPDMRRTVRNAIRDGGEPLRRAYVRHGYRPRRLVLLLDVSGSMEPYSRALVRFVHAAVVGRTKVEAFALGTRLTRITRQLQSRDPDVALDVAGQAIADWSGGTRLGLGLRAFNDQWGVRGMARGAIVVILSDGWDRGDPEVLATEMQRLHRVAFRVVWVNPLKASPGYAPMAKGMAAALPHVDEFIEGHSLSSLEVLAETIAA